MGFCFFEIMRNINPKKKTVKSIQTKIQKLRLFIMKLKNDKSGKICISDFDIQMFPLSNIKIEKSII